MNNFYLHNLPKDLKSFLILFLITIGIGIAVGLLYVNLTTNMTPSGTVERFNGSEVQDISDIPTEFPKPIENIILTTHDHVISFAMISFLIGFIFYFNSIIIGKFKFFLLIEPFISTIITFSSLWLMRYLYSGFSYLMILSAIIMYICWYIMIITSIFNLLKNKDN
tara:strand:- start:60 stop:557 length:498 start_codon:yes stop_codon:yes gene_type:complete